MVLNISKEEFLRMKGVILDDDRNSALQLIKKIVKRLEQQAAQCLKSHLDG